MHFAQHQRLDGIEFSVRRQVEILRGVLVDLKQAANFPPEVRGALLGFFPHLFTFRLSDSVGGTSDRSHFL